jgi:hypothetical protein
MTKADCESCSHAVWERRNIKCGYTGVPIYVHLVVECPAKRKEGK